MYILVCVYYIYTYRYNHTMSYEWDMNGLSADGLRL